MGYDINGVKIKQQNGKRKKRDTEMELTPENIKPLKKGQHSGQR